MHVIIIASIVIAFQLSVLAIFIYLFIMDRSVGRN